MASLWFPMASYGFPATNDIGVWTLYAFLRVGQDLAGAESLTFFSPGPCAASSAAAWRLPVAERLGVGSWRLSWAQSRAVAQN